MRSLFLARSASLLAVPRSQVVQRSSLPVFLSPSVLSELVAAAAAAYVGAVVMCIVPPAADKNNMDRRVDTATVKTVLVGCNKNTDSIG